MEVSPVLVRLRRCLAASACAMACFGATGQTSAPPSWCPEARAASSADAQLAELIQLASSLAARGESIRAVELLCAARMHRGLSATPALATNVANFAGTILFRDPGDLERAIKAFEDAIRLADDKKFPSQAATAHAKSVQRPLPQGQS